VSAGLAAAVALARGLQVPPRGSGQRALAAGDLAGRARERLGEALPLKGVITAVDFSKPAITVAHEEIPGFMEGDDDVVPGCATTRRVALAAAGGPDRGAAGRRRQGASSSRTS
jgi:hypothetical protein